MATTEGTFTPTTGVIETITITPTTIQTTITETFPPTSSQPPPSSSQPETSDENANIPSSPPVSPPTAQSDPSATSSSNTPDFRASDTPSSPVTTNLELAPVLSTQTGSSSSQSTENTSTFIEGSITTDFVVSTRIYATTDGTFGVRTFTEVTTIASYRAVPTHQNNSDTTMSAQGHGSSAKTGFIVLGVVGGLAVIVIGLLTTWFCQRRKKRKFHDYGINNYRDTEPYYGTAHTSLGTNSVNRTSTISTPPSNFGQRFGWALIQSQRNLRRTDTSVGVVSNDPNRITIASFENSEDRIVTPTPFTDYRTEDAPTEKQNPFADRRVQFYDDSPQDDGDPFRSDGITRTRQRNEEELVAGGSGTDSRPPTYYTVSSTGATVATTLPRYSVHETDMEMSPIYERSIGWEAQTTDSSLRSPLSYRTKPRRSVKTLSTIGEKI